MIPKKTIISVIHEIELSSLWGSVYVDLKNMIIQKKKNNHYSFFLHLYIPNGVEIAYLELEAA